MKNQKVIALVLLICLTASLFNGCGGTSKKGTINNETQKETENGEISNNGTIEPITIRVGTVTTTTSPYVLGLEQMAEKLKEYSNGAITLEIFPDSQLGGERDLIEGVGIGTVEMAVTSSSPLVNFVKDFQIFDLPYLITDRQQAYEVMDGEIGRSLLDQLKSAGVYGMAFWENGFRHLTNNKKEISVPGDVKGFKLRVMENQMHQDTWLALDAYPTPMAWGEVFTALEQGVIDGQENPLNAIDSTKIYEIQKYVSLTGHVYTPGVVLINNALWESFPKEVKEMFIKSESYAREWERNHCIEQDEKLQQELESKGVIFTEVDKLEWQKACESVYKKYANELNPDYVEALKGK